MTIEQRIRDLEAELGTSRRQFTTLARSIDGLRSRAERAEAELLHARGISEIREAERDKLAAKLDAVKAFIANRSVIGGMDRMRLAAILADTDEHTTHEFCDTRLGCILADTDEGNER